MKQWKILWSFLLLYVCFLQQVEAVEVVRFVDTGSDAAGDGTTSATSSGDNTHAYQSLFAWEAAEETDLDTANNTHSVHTNRTNGGGMDTTECVIAGWVTSATDFITIQGDDFPTDGIRDESKYVLHNNDASPSALTISENHVRVRDFQIKVTVTSTNLRGGIFLTGIAAANTIILDSILIKGVCSGTGLGHGIRVDDSSTLLTIDNCIVTGFKSGADTTFRGIWIDATNTADIYNCTLYGNHVGIERDFGTTTVINNAVFNNDDDYLGTMTITYSASDDDHTGDSATNVTISQSADDWAALVTDAAGDDFSVTNTSSELYQAGNGATPKSIFTDDIIGTERDAVDLNWDIGAFELIVAPPAGGARSRGYIIASIPFGIFGIACAFERSRRKAA